MNGNKVFVTLIGPVASFDLKYLEASYSFIIPLFQQTNMLRQSYRLEILRHTLSRDGLLAFCVQSARIARSLLFSDHRMVYALNPSSLMDGDAVERQLGYNVTVIHNLDTISEEEEALLGNNQKYFPWNIKTRLQSGSYCWLGMMECKLANIGWTTRGDRIEAYFFPLTKKNIIISHCATLPQWQGKGLYPVMLQHIVRATSDQMIDRIFIESSDWNRASTRGIQRAGFQMVGTGICKKNNSLLWVEQASCGDGD